MFLSDLSCRMSAESRTTVLSPVFFHQCEVVWISRATSADLCTIGTAQVLAYSIDDLAFDEVDDRRPVAVAVPGHDAARLDHELAQSQLAVLEFRRLLGKVDRGEHR